MREERKGNGSDEREIEAMPPIQSVSGIDLIPVVMARFQWCGRGVKRNNVVMLAETSGLHPSATY